MFEVDLGKIKFKWRGAYDATVGYTVDDVVRYNNNNYVCTANNGNTLPDVAPSVGTPFWDLMTQGVEAPIGTPADGDIVVYDAASSGQAYTEQTGVIAIYDHVFRTLGAYNSGSALSTSAWYKLDYIFDASTSLWGAANAWEQDWLDGTANAEMYPWLLFSPKYSNTNFKVEFDFSMGQTTGTYHSWRVMRGCIEDGTEERPTCLTHINAASWADVQAAYKGEAGGYGENTNAATYSYALFPVQITFVDTDTLDPSKRYYYFLEATGSGTTEVNYSPSYTSTMGRISTSRTTVTEFRNPS
jgi:hypothetical protein